MGGKHNVDEYRQLLDALETPWTIVADRDYLEQIGGAEVRELFQINVGSQAKALLENKKSFDRNALVTSLTQFVTDGGKENVLSLLDYVDGRHRNLKWDLTEDEHVVSFAKLLHCFEHFLPQLDLFVERIQLLRRVINGATLLEANAFWERRDSTKQAPATKQTCDPLPAIRSAISPAPTSVDKRISLSVSVTTICPPRRFLFQLSPCPPALAAGRPGCR